MAKLWLDGILYRSTDYSIARRNTLSLDGILYRSTAYSIARRHTLLRSCFPRQVRPDGILYGGVVFSRQLSLDEMNGTPEIIDLASTEYCIAELFCSVKLDQTNGKPELFAMVSS